MDPRMTGSQIREEIHSQREALEGLREDDIRREVTNVRPEQKFAQATVNSLSSSPVKRYDNRCLQRMGANGAVYLKRHRNGFLLVRVWPQPSPRRPVRPAPVVLRDRVSWTPRRGPFRLCAI